MPPKNFLTAKKKDIDTTIILEDIDTEALDKDYNMKWFCQDITNTTNLNKNSFNIIIDKATFDILASYNYTLLSTTFKQIIRLLTYNGILIIVSINKDLLNYCDINLVHIIATNKIDSNFKLIYIFILQKK